MPVRAWTIATLLLVTTILAGCTGSDEGGDEADATTPAPDGGGSGPSAPPQDFLIEDAGEITGPFTRTWSIDVDNVAYSAANIHFEMAGLQAGAPPTARVHLQLSDPEGNPVKTATLGVGGSGDSITWGLTPADTPTAGTYTLRAVAGSDDPLPSAGFASWALHAQVTY